MARTNRLSVQPLFDSGPILYNHRMRKPGTLQAFTIPRLRDVFFIACLGACLLLGTRMLNIDSDWGRHLALGEYMLNTGSIPTRDLLSHTLAGASRPAYEWLSQVLFALAYRGAGLQGLILLVGLIISSAHTISYTQTLARSKLPLLSMLIAILAAAAASSHWLPRPHVLTFLCLVLWLHALEKVRRGAAVSLWRFILLMLLWVNLHGGFVFGFLAWFAYLAGAILDQLPARKASYARPSRGDLGVYSKIGLVSLASSMITPSGWANWKAVLNNSSAYVLSRTAETMPVDPAHPWTWPFLLLLLLASGLVLLDQKDMPASHILLILGFGAAGLLMGRNVPLFVLAATPIIAERLGGRLERGQQWTRLENGILALQRSLQGILWPALVSAGVALAFGIGHYFGTGQLPPYPIYAFPVRACDWLSEHPQSGEMYNDLNWGGYLLYRLWPSQRVFIDSQTDFYGEGLIREYEYILTAGQGWEATLEEYSVTWIIVPRTSQLGAALQFHPQWNIVYTDDKTLIASRSSDLSVEPDWNR